jgi:hypothetical protein
MSYPMANGASLSPKTATTTDSNLPFSYRGVGFVVAPDNDGYWFVAAGGVSCGPYVTVQEALVAVKAWIDAHAS